MLSDAIKRAFEKKLVRGWGKWPQMYVMVDLHDVIIPGNYTRNNTERKLYPFAKEVLQWMSKRNYMCIILWTSSYPDATDDICAWLKDNEIYVNYVNENPECPSTDILDTSKKVYFDLLFDDKAGFNGDTDWEVIMKTLKDIGEWDKVSH